MPSVHIKEERISPGGGIGRWNPTFLLISDGSVSKMNLMMSSPASKYDGLYNKYSPWIRTWDKLIRKLYIWKIVSTKYYCTIFTIYFYKPFFKGTPSNKSRVFVSKCEHFHANFSSSWARWVQEKHFIYQKGCIAKPCPMRTQALWEQECLPGLFILCP